MFHTRTISRVVRINYYELSLIRCTCMQASEEGHEEDENKSFVHGAGGDNYR